MAIVASAEAGLRATQRASVIQLRAPGIDARRLEREATSLVAVSSLPVLISSRCDVALACGAAGVNLPEHDISVADARSLLGDHLIGRSVHSLEGALAAEAEGADFVVYGPVWATATHPSAVPVGLDGLRSVCVSVRVPVVAIGGLTLERAGECVGAGAAGWASISLFR